MNKRKSSEPPSALDEALAAIKKDQERRKKLPNADDLRKLRSDMRGTIDKAKNAMEDLERRKAAAKPQRTRSGLRRGAPQKRMDAYTDGNIVNKGMNEVEELFADDEQQFLKKQVREMSQVKELKYHHLRYLIRYEIFNDLKKIRLGTLKSEFNEQFKDPLLSKDDLRAEVRTSLFTNEQRDYINGFLQGIFEANKKDESGNLRHREMEYVSIVMLFETVVRIVKLIHGFKTCKDAIAFMKKKSRESLGISDDENEVEE